VSATLHLSHKAQRLPRHKFGKRLLMNRFNSGAYAGLVNVAPSLPEQLIEHVLAPDLLDHSVWQVIDSQWGPVGATLPLGACVLSLRRRWHAQFRGQRSDEIVTPHVVANKPEA
jgi:hypothetical protein